MREWINLVEWADGNPDAFGTTEKLYHGTNIDNLWLIMKAGKLSSNFHGRDYAGPTGVCLSRSFEVAKSHAESWAEQLGYSFFEYFGIEGPSEDFGSVVFEFQRNLISNELIHFDDGAGDEQEERTLGDLSLDALTTIYVRPEQIAAFLKYATTAHKNNAEATEYDDQFRSIIQNVLSDSRLKTMP